MEGLRQKFVYTYMVVGEERNRHFNLFFKEIHGIPTPPPPKDKNNHEKISLISSTLIPVIKV